MEKFNEKRLERCLEIAGQIMERWLQSGSCIYTVRTTKPLIGMTLDELRAEYFTVGVGDDLKDVPFTDLLVIFSAIEQEALALKKHLDENKPVGEHQIKFKVTTNWPDLDAARVLSQIWIQSPGDTQGRRLQFQVTETPLEEEDGPQT